MARKRALSTSTPAPATTASPNKKAANGSTPKSNAKSTRASTRVKAESPDASASMKSSPIVNAAANGHVKKEEPDVDDTAETAAPKTPARASTRRTRSNKKVKLEENDESAEEEDDEKPIPKTPKSLTATTPSKSTLAKKLKQLEQYLQTPFPDFPYPTPEQCQQVQDSLAAVHGLPTRPDKLIDKEGGAAGCGAVPDVLDALVRTILSQNTTSASESLTASLAFAALLYGSSIETIPRQTRRVRRMRWTRSTAEQIMQPSIGLLRKTWPKLSHVVVLPTLKLK